jgi:hypothetical protein
MTIRQLCQRHIQAWHALQRAPAGEASRVADRAAHEALEAVCNYVCTSEEDAWELYSHLLWLSLKQGDRMEPHARALLAAMRHTPGPLVLPPAPANEPANDRVPA